METCGFCETELTDGEMCNCEGAVAERAAAGLDSAEPDGDERPAEPEPSSGDSAAMATMRELEGFVQSFAKDPATAGVALSAAASFSILAAQGLCLGFMLWLALKYNPFLRASIAPGRALFMGCLAVALSAAVGMLCFHIITRCFFKRPVGADKLLGVVAKASAPWSLAFACCGLLTVILAPKALLAAYTALTILAHTFSLLLFNEGVAAFFENGSRRILAVAITYGISSPLLACLLLRLANLTATGIITGVLS